VSHFAGAVLKHLDQVFNQATALGLTEGKLLEQYVSARDEAAFGALVARHGPMVLGVCRRILRDEHDVEDAFQATFLVLARRAAAIRRRELVGHWLHGVARRVALRSRAQRARRQVHETAALQTAANGAATGPGCEGQPELHAILDDELARLPASLRSPVVLCYLEGLTHDEAAGRLRWPVGTLRSRMARARDLLRRRLARRGVTADGAAITAALARQSVPPELIDATARASFGFANAQGSAAGVASTAATALARGVLQSMTISKLGILAVTGLAAILIAGGAQTLARQQAGKRTTARGAAGTATKPAAGSTNLVDRTDALLRAVDRIDDVLDDLDRRNHHLQDELRALRKEIAALRDGEPAKLKTPGAAGSKPASAAPADPSVPRNVTIDRNINPPSEVSRVVPPPGAADRTTASAAPTGSVPRQFEIGRFILVISPQGNRLALYDPDTERTSTLSLPVEGPAGQVVTPIWAGGVIALQIKGEKISLLAAFDVDHRRWLTHELREPVNEATPLVAMNMAAYELGQYVYAFSAVASRWDTLEIPRDSKAHLGLVAESASFTVRTSGHIFVFSQSSGKWRDIDFNAILDASPSDDSKNAENPGSP
jgi:RNA polymerase sigma factor (sigma-70 family)